MDLGLPFWGLEPQRPQLGVRLDPVYTYCSTDETPEYVQGGQKYVKLNMLLLLLFFRAGVQPTLDPYAEAFL